MGQPLGESLRRFPLTPRDAAMMATGAVLSGILVLGASRGGEAASILRAPSEPQILPTPTVRAVESFRTPVPTSTPEVVKVVDATGECLINRGAYNIPLDTLANGALLALNPDAQALLEKYGGTCLIEFEDPQNTHFFNFPRSVRGATIFFAKDAKGNPTNTHKEIEGGINEVKNVRRVEVRYGPANQGAVAYEAPYLLVASDPQFVTIGQSNR